jgi:hypothetical protein
MHTYFRLPRGIGGEKVIWRYSFRFLSAARSPMQKCGGKCIDRLVIRLCVTLCVLCPFARLLGNDTALNDGREGPIPVGGLNGPESVIQMVSETINVDMVGRRAMSTVILRFEVIRDPETPSN